MQKKLANLCRLILADKDTRNLLFFLLLNFFMAFVELFYGLWTNSLGLISDSFHMFFDCTALILGLVASLIAKWKPNDKFTYGFGRAEILTGLANGLFLLFIALFIMKEAVERTFEPPDVHHERLFAISVLGFIVNLVGIFVFQHGGQGHHHHGGSCSHSHYKGHSHDHQHHHDHHDHHDHHHVHHDNHNAHGYSHYSSPTVFGQQQAGAIMLDMNGYPSSQSLSSNNNNNNNNQVHSNHTSNHRDHHHGDEHHYMQEPLIEPATSTRAKSAGRGQIMQSVFLHIVADTLGSIGVMVSALLMNQFGWMIADPLCSLFIAILIFISVYPLLRDSIFVLMQRIPVELDDKLPGCLYKIQNLSGVLSIHETHFWALNSDTYIGCLKLEIARGADSRFIKANAKNLLTHIGVEKANIQIDQIE